MSEDRKRLIGHKFTLQQRIELIKIFYSGKSLKQTSQLFGERHPDLEHKPTSSGITRLVKKFESTGSVVDKPIPGRPKAEFANRVRNEPKPQPKEVKQRASPPDVKASGSALESGACDWPGCGYVSNRKCLARHRLVHSNERNFLCEWPSCDKRFKSSVSLRNHLRIHYGDKRYACSWPGCKYRCVDSGNIRKHKKIHERHFQNLLKSSEFRSSSDLKSETNSENSNSF